MTLGTERVSPKIGSKFIRQSQSHHFSESLVNIFQKFLSTPPKFSFGRSGAVDQNREILRHFSSLDGLDDSVLELEGPLLELWVVIEPSSVP